MEKIIVSLSVILLLIMHYFIFKRKYKIEQNKELLRKQRLYDFYENSIKNIDLSIKGEGIDLGENLDFAKAIQKINIENSLMIINNNC